ncbi:single-stranded DNA-binding protein [Thermoflexus sp.]|uniref:single-stranded DNA-binding protein n=1 Tax=Thermoflexus sp. TaxID=1969742 RepID=UPI0035E4586A
MRGLNKVMIIGQVGRDPEMRFTPNGRPVTTFPVATPRTWVAGNGERREETEWFNVVAWGGLAEICKQRLRKGMYVYVEGRLQTRGWEDAEGRRHYRTELVANEMILLGEGRTAFPGFGEEEEPEPGEEAAEEFPF